MSDSINLTEDKEESITEERLKQVECSLPEDQQWQNLDISNDFMFAKVMETPELCKEMIERLLSIQIEKIEYPSTQESIHISKNAKSVRLDVYVKDEKNTVYNVEMQTTNTKNLPKRTRYYQGMIDLNLLEKGQNYRKLNRSFIIFICKFDLFGKGRHRYTFQNLCKEDTKIRLNDGTAKIFFNTKGTMDDVNEDVVNVLKFIETNESKDDFTKQLQEKVKEVKGNKKWEVDYMTLKVLEEEKFYEGLEKGLEKGEQKKETELVLNMYKNHLSLEQIASIAGNTVDSIVAILNGHGYKVN